MRNRIDISNSPLSDLQLQRLVVIDPFVPNYQQLIAGLLPNTAVVVLDKNQNSIDRISHALKSCGSIESLHLLAHGAPGQLHLGNTPLQALHIDRLAEKIGTWSQFLTQNAQILLYGCESGAGSLGRELVSRLHSLTNRLVAAASEPVGRLAAGCNWNLDVKCANFVPELAFQEGVLAEYAGTLAEPFKVSNITPSFNLLTNGNLYDLQGKSAGNNLYFPVRDVDGEFRLGKSDGTANGTSTISNFLTPPGGKIDEVFLPFGGYGPIYNSLLPFNNYVYFAGGTPLAIVGANSRFIGNELWRTDGTNVELVKDIVPGDGLSSGPDKLTQVGNKFFFIGATGNRFGQDALFISDGTEAGTNLVSDSFTSTIDGLKEVNGKLLFRATDNATPNNREIWVSDGNTASVLKDINGDPNLGSGIGTLTKVGNAAYFVATEPLDNQFEALWRTDGTTAGTTKVDTGTGFKIFDNLTDVNGTLFYTLGNNVYKANADGSNTKVYAGSDLLLQNGGLTSNLFNVNGNVFFTTGGNKFWKSDGTPTGTVNYASNKPFARALEAVVGSGTGATVFDNKLYYTSFNVDPVTSATIGSELYVTDGTADGTKLVKDINPGLANGSDIRFIGPAGGKLYFSAFDGNSTALWAVQADGVVVPSPKKRGNVTGGDTGGKLLNDEVAATPDRRQVGFEEIKTPPPGAAVGQTWVVIHGWNSNTGNDKGGAKGADDIKALVDSIKGNVGENDRVLALDWQEAAFNKAIVAGGDSNPVEDLAALANGRAASWITPVAEFAVRTLQNDYGINATQARESLNLVGHSLGTYVSSEIGRIYRDGGTLTDPFPASPETANTEIGSNGEGVRTLTALDPASSTNLPVTGYDLDGRASGTQNPEKFKDVSVFSRSYNGALSIAGNESRAVTADEAIQADFGNTVPNADEHARVVKDFAKTFGQKGLIGDLLGANAYQSLDNLPIQDFDILKERQVGDSGYRGILNVEQSTDPAADNRANLLIGQAKTGPDDNIVIGSAQDDDIQGSETVPGKEDGPITIGDPRFNGIGNDKLFGEDGNDTIRGKGGSDILLGGAGDDVLFGDGGLLSPGTGNDILYGGLGKDTLDGGGGADTFVFGAGDGSADLNRADVINDFQIGLDKIGLIGLDFNQLTIQNVDNETAATVSLGGEFLAKVQGVSAEQLLQNPDFFTSIDPNIFKVT